MTLIIRLLGPAEITQDDVPVRLPGHKPLALLAYLLVTGKPHTRQNLVDLLFDEANDPRASLRWTLAQIRQAIGSDYLLTDRFQIAFNFDSDYWLDTAVFETGQSDLYRGDFLEGLFLRDAHYFMDWLLFERERLRDVYQVALTEQLQVYESREEFQSAIQTAQQLIRLDNLREEWHRALMHAYAQLGKREAALAQYESCRRILEQELGVEPSAETEALGKAIRSGQFGVEAHQIDYIGADEASPFPSSPSPVGPSRPLAYSSPNRREQLVLLEKVKNFWVKGVLEKSIQDLSLIELARRSYSEAIDHPWNRVIGLADYESHTSSIQGGILDTFTEADRALLILGAPGAGKTTTLLELARELITLAERDLAQPIPVILNLSSWAEKREAIADWLVEELAVKYQIPRKIGRAWLEDNELLFLLDGLDEVPGKHQADCVNAVNQFREEYGLVGIAVCARFEDYEIIGVKLRLGGAIVLQPLTKAQVDKYLLAAGSRLDKLRKAIQKDATLQEMVQSPLMLSVMSFAYRHSDGIPTPEILTESVTNPGEAMEVRQQYLFDAYTRRMFHRRGVHPQYSPPQTKRWLAYLAQKMIQYNQSVFLIEQIQPSWLSSRGLRWLYLLTSRLLDGLIVGIFLWLATLLLDQFRIQLETSFFGIQQGLFVEASQMLQIPPAYGSLLLPVILNLGLGLVVGVIDGFYFERHLAQDEANTNTNQRWQQLTVVGLTVGCLTLLLLVPFFSLYRVLATAIFEGVYFVLISTYHGSTFREEIRTAEAITWSWSGAFKWTPPGLLSGLIVGLLYWQLYGGNFWIPVATLTLALAFFLLGGLHRGILETKNSPNEGIWLSARNGVLAALVSGLLFGLLYGLWLGIEAGIIVGLQMGLTAGLIFGGSVIGHFLVRLFLWRTGETPWNYAQFLDYAASCVFLRKVGNGYIFTHRLLQGYFASLLPSEHQPVGFPEHKAKETAQQLMPYVSGSTSVTSSKRPRILGQRFVEEELIAVGGMGEVYRGHDTDTGQRVAIKRLRPEVVVQNPEAVTRFVREGEMLRQLNHPNIVKMLAIIESENQHIIIMEYVPGGTLRNLLDQQPHLPLDRILSISLELADALARAHHLNIIHRDLKPENVLLAEDGTPRLTDFGIATLGHQEMRLTRAGAIIGTMAYLSPEACTGKELDGRSDIWSFGVLMYEMLTGKLPFEAQEMAPMLIAILNDPIPDITQFREAPAALVNVINRMLVKRREARISSVRQIAAELETIRNSLAYN